MDSGIYMWTSPSGKSYIGQTINLKRRYSNFLNFYNSYSGNKIDCARKKYNKPSNWKYEILEYCDIDELDMREQHYIELYNTMDNGYNSNSGGNSNKNISNETKQKISETHKGSGNPFYGKHHSFETKQKYSETRKGIGNNFYGKHHTEETKRKLRESNIGKYDGEKNPNSKAVIQLSKNGEFIAEFSTMKEASETIGRSISSISSCCGNKDKRTTVGGFKWVKAEDYYKQMESV